MNRAPIPTDQLSCPAEVLSRVLDGEAVLLHLGSGTYFGMNPVASRAWEHIVGRTSFGALCEKLCAEFEVDAAELEADMQELVGALLAQGLVIVTPAGAD